MRNINLLTLCLMFISTALLAQTNTDGVSITCEISQYEDEKIPNVKSKGVSVNFKTNKQVYLYPAAGAVIQLCSESDIVEQKKSDVDGFVVFKSVQPGTYTIKVLKDSYVKREVNVKVENKPLKRIFFLEKQIEN